MSSLLLFNKPYNVVCQFSGEQHEQTLADYLNFPGYYAAGRLDKNSEGLLILTNDGRLQHRLSDPRYDKQKHYWVQVEGVPRDADLNPLRKGLVIPDQAFKPILVRLIEEPTLWLRNPPIRTRATIPTSWLSMVLTEGKNHQIRKMTAFLGFPTLRLIRYQIDEWKLENLLPGEYRLLSF